MRILIYDTGKNQVWLNLNIRARVDDLEKIQGRLDDTKALEKRIGYIMRRGYALRFQEGGPGWKEDAPSTVAAKALGGLPPRGKSGKTFPRLNQLTVSNPSASVLIASGALRDSYVQKYAPNHISKVIRDDDGFTCIEGSKDPKAEFHQKGTPSYIIVPVKAKHLRFIGGNGSVVFRSVVNHPGLPARPVTLTERDHKLIDAAVEEHIKTGESAPSIGG